MLNKPNVLFMNKYSSKQFWISGSLLILCTIIILAWQNEPRSARIKKDLDSFKVEPGMRIDLMVAEPLVIDPVAIAFDEDRQMYIVEDRRYPDPAEGGLPTKLGRVA